VNIQLKATEQYFPVVLFNHNAAHGGFKLLSLCVKSLKCEQLLK